MKKHKTKVTAGERTREEKIIQMIPAPHGWYAIYADQDDHEQFWQMFVAHDEQDWNSRRFIMLVPQEDDDEDEEYATRKFINRKLAAYWKRQVGR